MAFDRVCEIRRAGISPEGLAQLDLKAEGGAFDWTWFLSRDGDPFISEWALLSTVH